MISKKTRKWLKAAGIRAGKTMTQTAVALLPTAATITAVDWATVIGTVALVGIASLLTSVAGLPDVKKSWNHYKDCGCCKSVFAGQWLVLGK